MLPDFPVRPDFHGIGLSDCEGYAELLSLKLSYTNTRYHQDPKLDITDIDPSLEGALDFLASTDVFEHIAPPVSAGFTESHRLLRPGGVLIFSAPHVLEGETREHFPALYNHKVVKSSTSCVVGNITRDGREEIFRDLIFHGGVGSTLEMWMLSISSLLGELARAGFQEVRLHGEPLFDYGNYWWEERELPITARKARS